MKRMMKTLLVLAAAAPMCSAAFAGGKRGRASGGCGGQNKERLNHALHVNSHPNSVSSTSYFLSRRTREMDSF